MKAVVMAGGQGARLRPLTSNQPKPMLPVLGEPMMEHILRLARRHGFTEVVATVHFLASIVRNYFGDGSDLDISLSYATEEEPLGTAGSVKNAEPLLGTDRFLVLSGDSVTDVDLTELVRFHEKKGAAVTVAVKRLENPLEFGIVITGEDGRVERFLEKPGWGDVFSDQVNTGVYVIEPEVLNFIPPDEEFDFSKDLFPLLLEKGLPIYGHVTDRYWTDVGNLDAYMEAHRAVLDRQVDVHIEGFDLGKGVWLGPGAELDPGAHVEGPVFIGENSRVEAGATLREHTVLGRGVVVRSGAFLHRAIIHDYVYIGPATNLRGCVIGKNSDVHFGARVEEPSAPNYARGQPRLVRAAVVVEPVQHRELAAERVLRHQADDRLVGIERRQRRRQDPRADREAPEHRRRDDRRARSRTPEALHRPKLTKS